MDAERILVALKRIGFSAQEISNMDMSEALDLIDAANPPDDDEVVYEATQADIDAFCS